jgi:putative DNA primase/helicase
MSDDGEPIARIEDYQPDATVGPPSPKKKRRRTNGHDLPTGNGADGGLPVIYVRAGDRHLAADAGLAALIKAGTPFYQRGRSLVRVCMIKAKAASGEVTPAPGIVSVSCAALGRELGRAAHWVGCDRNGEHHRTDPPKPVVEQIAEMAGDWPFPVLSGVIGTPTLRADGSPLVAEGYDEATGLVLIGGPKMPPIPREPTQCDAEQALALLDELLDEFPFADADRKDQSVNRAVALSMITTPVLRGALEPVPLHLVTAPQPGTGKSYLADIGSMIATGDRCAVVSASPSAEETEKRLVGAALTGLPIIALDNCSEMIQGAFLCQLTERPLLQLRPLGTSDTVRVANTFTVLANGNNATIAGDMVRRTIQCALDANMENPEARQFHSDPIAMVKSNRSAYIAACLTIARAYICAGRPRCVAQLPSYSSWSDLVRSALVWLGRPDPVLTMNAIRSADPVRQARVSVFTAWAKELGAGGAYRTSELIERAQDGGLDGQWLRPLLREALLEVARTRSGEPKIDSKRLGIWLRSANDTVAEGYKLTIDRSDKTRPRWVLNRLLTDAGHAGLAGLI